MAAESFGGPYCFPYPPYDIQTTLMSNIYDVFTHKKVGIFESPTGTVCGDCLNGAFWRACGFIDVAIVPRRLCCRVKHCVLSVPRCGGCETRTRAMKPVTSVKMSPANKMVW